MSGDYDDDDDNDDEDNDKDATIPDALRPYYGNLETYVELARWSYMADVAQSSSAPVDDIPQIQPSDFLAYFLNYFTRQPSVENQSFMNYDEMNRNSVIEASMRSALKKSIPPTVLGSLMTSSQSRPSSRLRKPLSVKDQFSPDMMSSRAVAFRSQTKSQTAQEETKKIEEVEEEMDEEPQEEEEESKVPVEQRALGTTTAAVQLGENKDAQDNEDGVERVDLDTLQTQDFKSES